MVIELLHVTMESERNLKYITINFNRKYVKGFEINYFSWYSYNNFSRALLLHQMNHIQYEFIRA